MGKKHQNEDWMRSKYHDEGLTGEEIAEEAGVSRTTAYKWLKKHDIERRDPNKLRQEKAEDRRPDADRLREMYHGQEMALDEIGGEFDVTRGVVIKWMDNYGIDRRSPEESRAVRGTGTNQFDHGKHREEEWLREKYHTEKMTVTEMADEADVTEATIVRQMQKNGVESRPNYVSHVLRNPGAGFVQADARGYEMIKHSVGDHTYNFPLHRLLAIAKYGYDEVKDSVVHHKNGLEWGNWHENIELFDSQEEHARHHGEKRGGLNG